MTILSEVIGDGSRERRLGSGVAEGAGRKEANGLVSFALATDMARAGRYDEAEALIEKALAGGASRPHALDLRARMLAQQRRYAEAEACWLEAVRLDPGNRGYRKALDAIQREGAPRALWVVVGLTAMIVMVGVAAAVTVRDAYKSLSARLVQAEALRSAYAQQRLGSQRLDMELRAAKAQSAATAARFAEFRGDHSHSNDEFKLLSDAQSRLDSQLASARKELAAERTRNDDLTKQHAGFNDQLNRLTRQQAGLTAALGTSREELGREVAVARESRQRMLESTITIFQSLRPLNADEVARRLKELKAERARLRDRVAQYEKRNLVPFRLLDARVKLAECEKRLKLCQAEYDARVVPWEASMAKLRAACTRFRESATPPASLERAPGTSVTQPMEKPRS